MLSLTIASTCEVILTGSALFAAWLAARVREPIAVLGFLLLGVASAAGALEFGGLGVASGFHQYSTLCARWLVLPLLAVGTRYRVYAAPVAALALIGLGTQPTASWSLATNVLAMLVFAAAASKAGRRVASSVLAGLIVFALANFGLGARMAGVVTVLGPLDAYHLLLCIATLLLSVPYRARRHSRRGTDSAPSAALAS
jgi:hypothetical protein